MIAELCSTHHRMSKDAVHNCRETNMALKEWAQRKFMEMYPDLDFMSLFGCNYLTDD